MVPLETPLDIEPPHRQAGWSLGGHHRGERVASVWSRSRFWQERSALRDDGRGSTSAPSKTWRGVGGQPAACEALAGVGAVSFQNADCALSRYLNSSPGCSKIRDQAFAQKNKTHKHWRRPI